MASGRESEVWGLSRGISKQPLTSSCLKQQDIHIPSVPLVINFARCTLKDLISF